MTSQSLIFLKELFIADPTTQAEMILQNYQATDTNLSCHFSDACDLLEPDTSVDRFSNPLWSQRTLSVYPNDLDEAGVGWHWVLYSGWPAASTPGSSTNKGLRDWGYVLWDKERMLASKVLPESSGIFHDALDHWFRDNFRSEEPCALKRPNDPKIQRIPRVYRYESDRDSPDHELDARVDTLVSGRFWSQSPTSLEEALARQGDLDEDHREDDYRDANEDADE